MISDAGACLQGHGGQWIQGFRLRLGGGVDIGLGVVVMVWAIGAVIRLS